MKFFINPPSPNSTCILPCKGLLTLNFFLPILFFLGSLSPLVAQPEIPVGTWRMHLSYNKIISVTAGSHKIFAAGESGILLYDKDDQSLSVYNKLTGLSATGISCIAYDEARDQLLIAYIDGNLDLIKNNTVINFNRLKNSTITGSKKINHICMKDALAYLSTDYGIVVFDMRDIELKETWRDLGAMGANLKIFATAFAHDSIFAATENGIIAGSLSDNLLDYNYWKRFDSGELQAPVASIAVFNNSVYAAFDGKGVFRYTDGNWLKQDFLQSADFNYIGASSGHLLIAESTGLWRLDVAGTFEKVENELITVPVTALEDLQGNLWIGDAQSGLVSNISGNFDSYIPNGPTIASAFRLKFRDEKVYALSGGFTASGQPIGNDGTLNFFEEGKWEVTETSVSNLTDVAFLNQALYVSSFGGGVEKSDDSGNNIIYDHANSTLQIIDDAVYVTALRSSAAGLWVANYGVENPLHLLNDNTWQSFPLTASAKFPTDLAVDFEGNVWMVLDPQRNGGLLVFNKTNNESRYLTDTPGNGGLPSRSVYSIAVDRDGYVWVGTGKGIAYFFSASEDAVQPIFENRFLLRDEKINAIEVDGGNRKWIGTENGVWLVAPPGDALIQNFTTENSPLPSNIVRDIEINDITGEVFFSTDKGIVSYRSDATAAGTSFENLKIFPNPVTADFNGTVGITGLATDAIVKITDASGKLVWEAKANGGMAAWNVRDYNGKRAATGIYLVFAATADGREGVVGKIAVIN